MFWWPSLTDGPIRAVLVAFVSDAKATGSQAGRHGNEDVRCEERKLALDPFQLRTPSEHSGGSVLRVRLSRALFMGPARNDDLQSCDAVSMATRRSPNEAVRISDGLVLV